MASTALLDYMHSLGLSDAQVQAILTGFGTDQAGGGGPLNEDDVAAAAARFAAALANGTLNPPPAGPGTTTPGTTPGTTPEAMNAARDAAIAGLNLPPNPLAANPAASLADMAPYYQALASGFQSGAYTPYQQTLAAQGRNPLNSKPDPYNASPEATLPGGAYAGTVFASALTPDQASAVQYNTPEFAQYLSGAVEQGRGDTLGLTRANLQNSYTSKAFAGKGEDLMAAIQTARQADYAQWIARLRQSGIDTSGPGYSQATYERGMGLQPLTSLAAPGQRAPSGTPPTTGQGYAAYGVPTSAATPDYTQQVGTSFTKEGIKPFIPPPAAGGKVTSPGKLDTADLAALDNYIHNLSAVKKPSAEQQQQLATYQKRKAEYTTRLG